MTVDDDFRAFEAMMDVQRKQAERLRALHLDDTTAAAIRRLNELYQPNFDARRLLEPFETLQLCVL